MTLLLEFIHAVIRIYYWLIIVRVIVSWFPQLRDIPILRPVFEFIFDVTDPFLGLFRRIIPTAMLGGVGIDFSPFLAIITLIALDRFITIVFLQFI